MARLTLARQAQVAYEAVRALSDERQPPWGNLHKDEKAARVEEVKALRAGQTHEAGHIAESTEALRAGADPAEQVAYADLPLERRLRDELTAAIVAALVHH